jgi:hypothetical protein
MKLYSNTINAHDEDVLEPVTEIRARAALKPPGVQLFFEQSRWVEKGPITLEGTSTYSLTHSLMI